MIFQKKIKLVLIVNCVNRFNSEQNQTKKSQGTASVGCASDWRSGGRGFDPQWPATYFR